MQIRLSSPLQSDSVVDGEGIRAVIWTQGCPHHCKGCHNPETHSFNKGFLKDVDELINEIKSLDIKLKSIKIDNILNIMGFYKNN